MDIVFISKIVLCFSFAVMFFIFLRNFPLLSRRKIKKIEDEEKFIFRVGNNYRKGKIKAKEKSHYLGEKTLRKIKVWALRIDNRITLYLEKLRGRNINLKKNYFSYKKKEVNKERNKIDLTKEKGLEEKIKIAKEIKKERSKKNGIKNNLKKPKKRSKKAKAKKMDK